MNDKNLLEYIHLLGLTNEEFAKHIGVSYDTLKTWLYRNKEVPKRKVDFVMNKIKIHKNYTESKENIQTSNDDFFSHLPEPKPRITEEESNERKTPFQELQEKWERDDNYLIPLYDDVSTIGGNRGVELNPVTNPTEYINAGSWFGKTKLTAGIRHYGDSMIEYPSGCILAIKEIHDFRNVIPGQNYVIETDEIRVTKRIQLSSDNSIFMAYSSNTDTYPDGTLIHQPFPIEKETIRKILLVIGRIVKEHSSGVVIAI